MEGNANFWLNYIQNILAVHMLFRTQFTSMLMFQIMCDYNKTLRERFKAKAEYSCPSVSICGWVPGPKQIWNSAHVSWKGHVCKVVPKTWRSPEAKEWSRQVQLVSLKSFSRELSYRNTVLSQSRTFAPRPPVLHPSKKCTYLLRRQRWRGAKGPDTGGSGARES